MPTFPRSSRSSPGNRGTGCSSNARSMRSRTTARIVVGRRHETGQGARVLGAHVQGPVEQRAGEVGRRRVGGHRVRRVQAAARRLAFTAPPVDFEVGAKDNTCKITVDGKTVVEQSDSIGAICTHRP
ncbi:hypothetical protein QRX60_32865 [Amycolatopsis mongoliensis]|uniref:Uncharacterized protein n=1 Tax=Amycolatopsis mongoliensis TaxID=715475 RepID=A0A9Y2NGM7_9PSEU|nr:hypothetical protein [Amycolatopsis sp. 4-36]WIX98832.1 hypothetical protein QRX60_32865 [Amycolatopsis sp. 4-36]